jgi:hypothetical protein
MSEGLSSQELPESDEALATRAAGGDQAAFVALCDRHFHDVYDFLARLLLSRRRTAPAVLSAFLRVRRRLSEGHWRGNPRLALLAAAYQAAVEEGGPSEDRVAAGGEEGEEPLAFAQVDPDKLASPGEMAPAQEEALIIWEAAASLDRTEYALLDLDLRRGLDAAQAGHVVGMGSLKATGMLSRLRKAAEEAFTSLLMLRLGRRQCAELEQLAVNMERAILSPESRELVSGHVAACPTCSEARKRLLPPLKVLTAILPVSLAPGVKESVFQDLLAYTAAQAGAGVAAAAATGTPPSSPSMGPPPQRPRAPLAGGSPAGGPAFAILMGAAAILALPVVALALWLTVLSGDNGNGSAGLTPTPLGGGIALEGCGPERTCTPTPTLTGTSTPTSAPATRAPAPTGMSTPSPTASPTEPPTETPTTTPVGQGTPTGIVETATPKPSPGPVTTPTAVRSPSPARSPSPSPLPSPH